MRLAPTDAGAAGGKDIPRWASGGSAGPRRVLCVACLEAVQRRDVLFNGVVEVIAPLGFAVVGALLLARTPGSESGWLCLNFALFFLCVWLLIIPHELGHAVVGRLAGFRVFEISIGIGTRIFRHRRGELTLQWCALPLLGYVFAATPDPRFYRSRLAAFVTGGLAVNAVLLALLLPPALPFSGLEERLRSGLALTPALAAANAYLLGINLIPWKIKLPSAMMPSDGLKLISLLFLKRDAIEEWVQQYPIIRWIRMRESRGREQASQWLRETLKGQPLSNIMRCNLGGAWIDVSDFRRARELFQQCLEGDDPQSEWRWLFLNNVVYTDLLLEDPGLLPEADLLSEEAIALAPTEPHVMSTRGTVLTHLDRVDEGIALLEEAYRRMPDAFGKASAACSLAQALLKKGERERARDLIAMAERLDPSCIELKKVHQALAQDA